jgi:LuxR family maltose regulon positive regulatory protein
LRPETNLRILNDVMSAPKGTESGRASGTGLPLRGARRLIERTPLMGRLMEARRRRYVFIQGQAGSGKTSTLLAWRKELLALDYDVAWLGLGVGGDLPGLLDQLMASLGEIDGAMVREAALLMGHDYDEDGLEHIAIALVQGIAVRQRELVVMVDDGHLLDDARAYQLLQWLLDYGPANLHLAFASRTVPPLSLERLRLQGQLIEIGMRELRFSEEESERFLREQLGHIEPRDARALHQLTDGWVAGLQLFALDVRHKRGGAYAAQEVRDAQDFSRYIEREVLSRLSAEDLRLLTSLSACNRFCAPLCAALLGKPQWVVRMRSWLALLERDNFFITPDGATGRDTWYRLHPLLRETLQARLALEPAEERRALHVVAWQWFASRSEIDDAVHHAVQADNIDAAAEMAEAGAREMLTAGELNRLAALLRRLPAEQVQARVDLHIVQAYLQLYGHDLVAARRSLDLIERRGDALDPLQRYDLLLLQAAFAVQQDDFDAVIARRAQMLAMPPGASDFAWMMCSNLLGWAYIMRGEFEQARQAFAADEHAVAVPRSRLLARWMTAVCLAMEGRARQAEPLVRDVLREAEARGAACVSVACLSAALLAEMLYETNDCEAALGLLEPRIALLERVALPDTVLRAFSVMSGACAAMGRADKAEVHIDRLEAYAMRHGLDRLLAEAWLLRVRSLLGTGATDAAEKLLQRLRALASRHDSQHSTARRVRRAAGRAQAEALLHFRDFSGALACLQALISECEGEDTPIPRAALLLQAALALQGQGDADRARESLVAALRAGHQHGLLRSLVDPVISCTRGLSQLLAGEQPEPVLAWYQRRLGQAVDSGAPTGASQAASDAAIDTLSAREAEVLGLVAQAMTNKKIARALEVSPDTVKFHLKRIFEKLGVAARDEAVARWRDRGAAHSAPHARGETTRRG